MNRAAVYQHLKHNAIVNLLDGAFFGFALGFSSFVTVLPLFVSSLTSSAVLIGLVPAIHNAGWQLPQLFTARWVAGQKRLKPLVMALTSLERLPFLGLAFVAALLPHTSPQAALVITFALLIVQGLGAGLTANPWQSLIGKIIPSERRATFFGAQAAAANLLASLSALLAGILLNENPAGMGFAFCFALCFLSMLVSWVFLGLTREAETPPAEEATQAQVFWQRMGAILRGDRNFRWFLFARMVSQFALMGFAFYTVYAVNVHGVSKVVAGGMTSVLLAAQIAGNVIMGWVGDRWSRKGVMEVGLAAAALSALLAWWAPSPGWFYLVFGLAALANVAIWTIGLAMSLEFGQESERPAYIGMANTLIAPANIVAPFLGGWLADLAGYPTVFLASAFHALLALLVFQVFVHERERPSLNVAHDLTTGPTIAEK